MQTQTLKKYIHNGDVFWFSGLDGLYLYSGYSNIYGNASEQGDSLL